MKIEARAPLKRTKGGIENTTVVAAVNGSKETKNASADKGRVPTVFAYYYYSQ